MPKIKLMAILRYFLNFFAAVKYIALFMLLLGFTGCTFSVEKKFPSLSVGSELNVFLKTAEPVALDSIVLKFDSCDGITRIHVTESIVPPLSFDPSWVNCSTDEMGISYRLGSSLSFATSLKPGKRIISIYSMDTRGQISPVPHQISLLYSPGFVIGEQNALDIRVLRTGLDVPSRVLFAGGRLYIGNVDRVNVYKSLPTQSASAANFALGWPSWYGKKDYVDQATLASVHGIASDGIRLGVLDSSNRRLLIWNSIPTDFGQPADIVIGQSDFYSNGVADVVSGTSLSGWGDVAMADGKLFVSDPSRYRILIWDSIPTVNNQPADRVLGQVDLSTVSPAGTTASKLGGNAYGLFYVNDTLYVTDLGNSRILGWTGFSKKALENNLPADFVLGAPDFTTKGTLKGVHVFSDGGRLVVSETSNNRVLIWNSLPTAIGIEPDLVIGQSNISETSVNGGLEYCESWTLNGPSAATIGGDKLIVSDTQNNRVLIYDPFPTSNGAQAAIAIGQPSTSQKCANKTLAVTPNLMSGPTSVSIDSSGGKYYVTDHRNHRILRFDVSQAEGVYGLTDADMVWGQEDFVSNLKNGGSGTPTGLRLNYPIVSMISAQKYLVVDSKNHRVLIFNSVPVSHTQIADLVLGQVNFTTGQSNFGGVSASALSTPSALWTDGVRLAIADSWNNRVLLWNTFPTENGQAADVVLGQSQFSTTSINPDGVNARSLFSPKGVAFDEMGRLAISDTFNNRILIWSSWPTTNGAPADIVLGQSDFTSNSVPSGNRGALNAYRPHQLLYKYGRFMVLDTQFSPRVLIWDKGIPTSSNLRPDRILNGQIHSAGAKLVNEPLDHRVDFQGFDFDGARIIAADESYGLLKSYNLPDVSLWGSVVVRPGIPLKFRIHECLNRAKVLINEGGAVSATQAGWIDCKENTESLFSYTPSSGEGIKNIKIWFKDSKGHVLSGTRTFQVAVVDNGAPMGSDISIAKGISSSIDLSVKVSACNGDYVYIAEENVSPQTTDGGWQVCATSLSYRLKKSGEGNRRLYVWSKDSAGNISNLPQVYDFDLDITPPGKAPSVFLSKAHLSNIAPKYKLTMNDCDDAASVLVNLGGRPPEESSSWVTCSTAAGGIQYNSVLSLAQSQTLHVWSKDGAGNVSLSSSPVQLPAVDLLTLGQASSSEVVSAEQGFAVPYDIATSADGTRFAVADFRNSRVLLYDQDPTLVGVRPSVVLGQDSFHSVGYPYVSSPVNAAMIASPTGIEIVGEKVIVVDSALSRVLIWDQWPNKNNQPADLVLGQKTMSEALANSGGVSCATLRTPNGVSYDGSRLYVGDTGNNRVLIWSTFPTESGKSADFVLGQSDCKTRGAGIAENSFKGPTFAHSDGATLAITDQGNHRILIYDIASGSLETGAAADFVVGQVDMTSGAAFAGSTHALAGTYGVNTPYRSYVWAGKLYISDFGAQRVLVHNAIPTMNGRVADIVLGQANFTTSNTYTAESRIGSVIGMARTENSLFISSYSLNLIKKIENNDSSPLTTNKMATSYRGTSDLSYNGFNLSEAAVTSKNELQAPSSSKIFLNLATGKYMLAVADSLNHRVLLWNQVPSSTQQEPDIVLGQPSFTEKVANNPGLSAAAYLKHPTDVASDGISLFIADRDNNRVLVWNTIPAANAAEADFVLGQTDFFGTASNRGGLISAGSLSAPENLLIDSGRLLVSDRANHRVLVWTSLPNSAGQEANLVVGQSNFTAKSSVANASTIKDPQGLAVADGRLFVVASSQNRVMVWNSFPDTNGRAADLVLGQSSMTSTSNSSFYIPAGITADSDGVWVMDYFRLHFFPMEKLSTGMSSLIEVGQGSSTDSRINYTGISPFSFSAGKGIEKHDGHYWITDTSNHRILKLRLPF